MADDDVLVELHEADSAKSTTGCTEHTCCSSSCNSVVLAQYCDTTRSPTSLTASGMVARSRHAGNATAASPRLDRAAVRIVEFTLVASSIVVGNVLMAACTTLLLRATQDSASRTLACTGLARKSRCDSESMYCESDSSSACSPCAWVSDDDMSGPNDVKSTLLRPTSTTSASTESTSSMMSSKEDTLDSFSMSVFAVSTKPVRAMGSYRCRISLSAFATAGHTATSAAAASEPQAVLACRRLEYSDAATIPTASTTRDTACAVSRAWALEGSWPPCAPPTTPTADIHTWRTAALRVAN